MNRLVITLLLSIVVSFCACAQAEEGAETYHNNYVATMMKEAEQGNAEAQTFLGIMYQQGIGLAKDVTKAAKWYREAADQEDSKAASMLGIMYADGLGVPQDEEEALTWFRKGAISGLQKFSMQPILFAGGYEGAINAAESGNELAKTIVGKMYLTGSGVTQSDDEAVRWLTEGTKGFAAAGAQEALGTLYEEGRGGLPKDKAEAIRLYRMAAEQTAANLESSVRMVYESGPM